MPLSRQLSCRQARLAGLSMTLVAALFCLLAAAGCRSPGSAPGRTVITYWEKWTGFEGEAMAAVVDEFNRRQQEIFVRLLTISRVDQKMLLATAGGHPPDVVGLWAFNLPMYAEKNALRPLDDDLARDGITRDDYIPAYWDLCEYRGRVWALPTTPASVALHWNKDLFEQAGLDPERPPRTLSELDAYAARLTRYDSDGRLLQAGFMPAEPGWWNWAWGYFFGGSLWDGQRPTADAAENLRAYSWVRSYAEQYGIQQLQTFQSGFGNFSSPQNAFLAGKVAMELQGVWMHNFISKYAPDLRWGAAPFPYPDDRPDLAFTSLVDADVLVIPRGARHPRQAWEFIRYVNSQEGMELLCLGQRKHTPLARVSDRFLREHPNPYIRTFIELARSRNAFSPPKFGFWTAYSDELNAAFDSIWLGQASPEQALGRVQERVVRLWQREQRRRRAQFPLLPGSDWASSSVLPGSSSDS